MKILPDSCLWTGKKLLNFGSHPAGPRLGGGLRCRVRKLYQQEREGESRPESGELLNVIRSLLSNVHKDPVSRFYVELLTDKPTDRQTPDKT